MNLYNPNTSLPSLHETLTFACANDPKVLDVVHSNLYDKIPLPFMLGSVNLISTRDFVTIPAAIDGDPGGDETERVIGWMPRPNVWLAVVYGPTPASFSA